MELYERRSISECLSEGWTLMSTNIGRIAKSMWWPVLLTVIFAGIAAPVMFVIEKHSVENNIGVIDGLLAGIFVIAMFAIMIVFTAKIFKLLNEQTTQFCIKRTAKLTGVIICVAILITMFLVGIVVGAFFLISKGIVAQTIGIGLFALVYILAIIAVFIVYSPISYVGVKYLVEPEMKLKEMGKAYKRGWKNLGKIIGFTLLSSLIITIAQCVISLPGVIAMLAASLSLQGIALGDPSGLPSSFMVIFGITAGVSCFITCILMIWFTLSEYYLYGSIEAKYRS